MPQIDSKEYLNYGQYTTGKPGSIRQPYYIVSTIKPAVGLRRVTIPTNELENRSRKTFFIERIFFASDTGSQGTMAFAAEGIRVRPAQGRSWMESIVPVWPLFDCDGHIRFERTIYPKVLSLPEPYPIAPGNTVQVDLQTNLDASPRAQVCVGLVGYTETIPAYIQPRFEPFYMGQGIIEDTGEAPPYRPLLDDGETETFRFQVGEEAFLRYLGIRCYGVTEAIGDFYAANDILVRYQISGKKKSMETPVPLGGLQDYHNRMIPLYDTRLEAGDTLEVEVTNRTGEDIYCLVALDGYRRRIR